MSNQFKPVLYYSLLLLAFFAVACSTESDDRLTLFEKVPSSHSNIDFSNDLTADQKHNIYTNKDFYAGGGVGIGDINNNGLPDIYLVSNQGSNKLYLNKGNFVFEDITEQAGVAGSKSWSTGVSFVDINGNGYLDIYVTNSGADNGEDRKNELFVNNGDLTFTESAEQFGIADSGYSIHASFFDYNNNGYLDMYLLNNYAYQPIGRYELASLDREERVFEGGDRLYRNDGGRFTDVTEEAGIYSSGFSFGLGVSVGDINRNGWLDMYISNDFFERDYLYLNNGDGTFREVLEEKLNSISTTSMGGDIADLDNDGFPEILVTDMLPGTEERLKTITDFIDWEQYREEVELGFHRKFTRNTLQYNNADGTFSEIGRYAGIEATDWSWGGLMMDFNLSGHRDIFIANGFYKDVTDKDHLVEVSRLDMSQNLLEDGSLDYIKLIDRMPTTPIPNYMFENRGGLRFTDRTEEWGVGQPGFSHGSAYGDLNGNGALDLVVNNVNDQAFVYRNRIPEQQPDRNWIQLKLEGTAPNTQGVGAKAEITANGSYWYLEQMPQRGFQSSMDPVLHVGLGEQVSVIDTLQILWPDGRLSVLNDVNVNKKLTVRQDEALQEGEPLTLSPAMRRNKNSNPVLVDISEEFGLDWRHHESSSNDFERSPLLFHMRSNEGPPVCSADINGNGREDFFAGGAGGQPGAVFLQQEDGTFVRSGQPALEVDSSSEDTGCLFFDPDGTGNLNLYVASGSSEFPAGSAVLEDRLYSVSDDGQGTLVRLDQALPRPRGGFKPTGVVQAADIDGDGLMELFVGERMMPPGFGGQLGYGVPVSGYILKNDGTGNFTDQTGTIAPHMQSNAWNTPGITTAAWGDLNGRGMPDLVVAGEWMPLTIFYNENGRLEKADSEDTGLGTTYGWWQNIVLADLNGNGFLDIVGGNHGLNSRFKASAGEPIRMWANDFNLNGHIEQIFSSYNNGEGPFPVALRQDLAEVIQHIHFQIPTFRDYAGKRIDEIFSETQLQRADQYKVNELASVVAWNRGDGRFDVQQLPFRAQLSPVYGILAFDIDGDGKKELLLGGNLDRVRPQAGPYDASFGTFLKLDADGHFTDLAANQSGFFIEGEVRAIHPIQVKGEPIILVSRNNDELRMFKVVADR